MYRKSSIYGSMQKQESSRIGGKKAFPACYPPWYIHISWSYHEEEKTQTHLRKTGVYSCLTGWIFTYWIIPKPWPSHRGQLLSPSPLSSSSWYVFRRHWELCWQPCFTSLRWFGLPEGWVLPPHSQKAWLHPWFLSLHVNVETWDLCKPCHLTLNRL